MVYDSNEKESSLLKKSKKKLQGKLSSEYQKLDIDCNTILKAKF